MTMYSVWRNVTIRKKYIKLNTHYKRKANIYLSIYEVIAERIGMSANYPY